MGSVALTAGTYLTDRLRAARIGDLAAEGFFDVERVEIQNGVANAVSGPSCDFYAWKAPPGGRDLLFFVGESQPSHRGYEFCNLLLDCALQYRVSRVFTFAAMATQVHPSAEPRVFAAVNQQPLLEELDPLGVQILQDGHISGLNGVMLAAASEHDLEAVCLLGEMPFFAIQMPNPKASHRVLKVFSKLADLDVNLDELDEQSQLVEREQLALLERMNQTMQGLQIIHTDEDAGEDFKVPEGYETEDESDPLASDERLRIAMLFEKALEDRSQALRLKAELDRLGVFKEYEDRFLDLFKQGG